MSDLAPQWPICQSCGMPLEKAEAFGTNASGGKVNEFCYFCFRDGAFTEPAITMQKMIEKCADIMAQQGVMPLEAAHALMSEFIPQLKRWSGS